MREPKLSQLLAAAAALLLRPPDAVALAALAETCGTDLDPDQARQDFYDVLCMPQSGRYVPPYAHALAKGTVRDGNWWHFPQPRYDGGDALASWYAAIGFEPARLDVDPMLRGPHRPLDQAGFVLAYLAALAEIGERDQSRRSTVDSIAGDFLGQNVGVWLDRFCNLLGGAGSYYLEAVAEAVEEAVNVARERYPAPIGERASVERRPDALQSACEGTPKQGTIFCSLPRP